MYCFIVSPEEDLVVEVCDVGPSMKVSTVAVLSSPSELR